MECMEQNPPSVGTIRLATGKVHLSVGTSYTTLREHAVERLCCFEYRNDSAASV